MSLSLVRRHSLERVWRRFLSDDVDARQCTHQSPSVSGKFLR